MRKGEYLVNMQRLKKLITLFKKVSRWLWIFILMVYSLLMLMFFILQILALPTIFILPFYLFVPGYAFTVAAFTHLRKLEKIIVSLGVSIALFTGIKGLTQTFGLKGLFSVSEILAIFSVVCLIVKLFKRK